MTMYLGIEIGGTKLQIGVGDGAGKLAALERMQVDPVASGAGIRRQLLAAVPVFLRARGLSTRDISGVGVGFGGPVEAATGTIARSHQIGGWEGFALADWCREQLGWPAVVHNDADAAGLAEACFGAGRGLSPIFYITMGSGIGGGLIIDRQIYRGAGAGAAEIGPLLVSKPGEFAADTRATVESICSGWSMAQRMQRTITRYLALRDTSRSSASPESLPAPEPHSNAEQLLELAGGTLEGVSAAVVARAARLGNRLAQQNVARTCRVLGWAIAQMITLLCPRRIIIGGGVSLMGEELLLRPLRQDVSRYVFAPFAESFDIVAAALGEAVVVQGALVLARQGVEGNLFR